MKNYKIEAFDIIEEEDNYIKNKQLIEKDIIIWDIDYYNIYNIYSQIIKWHKIISLNYSLCYYDKIEISDIYDDTWKKTEYFRKKYINEKWEFLSQSSIEQIEENYNDANEDFSNYKYKLIEFDNSYDWEIISNEYYNIYANKLLEDTYNNLKSYWIDIIWIKDIIEEKSKIEFMSEDEYMAYYSNPYINYFRIKVDISDKAIKDKMISYLENQLVLNWYTIERLKEKFLNHIKELDKECWTRWKGISIKTSDNTDNFIYLVLILYIENKIKIKNFNTNEIIVDLYDDKIIINPNIIIEWKALSEDCILYGNFKFTIWDFEWNLEKLNSNEKNWVIFFFTIINLWINKNLLEYKWKLEYIKKTYFDNSRTEKVDTYNKNYPNRFNKYSTNNNIWIKVSNDTYSWVYFYKG